MRFRSRLPFKKHRSRTLRQHLAWERTGTFAPSASRYRFLYRNALHRRLWETAKVTFHNITRTLRK